jgi:hypothetical protein
LPRFQTHRGIAGKTTAGANVTHIGFYWRAYFNPGGALRFSSVPVLLVKQNVSTKWQMMHRYRVDGMEMRTSGCHCVRVLRVFRRGLPARSCGASTSGR